MRPRRTASCKRVGERRVRLRAPEEIGDLGKRREARPRAKQARPFAATVPAAICIGCRGFFGRRDTCFEPTASWCCEAFGHISNLFQQVADLAGRRSIRAGALIEDLPERLPRRRRFGRPVAQLRKMSLACGSRFVFDGLEWHDPGVEPLLPSFGVGDAGEFADCSYLPELERRAVRAWE